MFFEWCCCCCCFSVLELGLDLVDPVPHVRGPCVDARVVRLPAADAPRHHSDLLPDVSPADDHGPAGVSGAGVLALLASAQHVVLDPCGGVVSVGGGALGVVPDAKGELVEDVRLRALLADAAPPHHGGHLAGVGVRSAGEADGADVVVALQGERVLHGDEGHVEVQRLGAESLVPHHASSLALEDLGLPLLLDVVLAKANLQVGDVVAGHTGKKK